MPQALKRPRAAPRLRLMQAFRWVTGGRGWTGLAVQLVLAALCVWLAVSFASNAARHFADLGIASGFDFLGNTAGFDVNQSLIAYDRGGSYLRVFFVGLLNTLVVSAVSIVLATLIGFAIGIGRLSRSLLVSRLCELYVELIRNLPLLFQILFWYLGVLATLPGPRQSLNLPGGVYLNNRGLIVPEPLALSGTWPFVLALLVALAILLLRWRYVRRRLLATGKVGRVWPWALAAFVALPAISLALFGSPLALVSPQLRGFNFAGGVKLIPEFVALAIALSTYTAAFIAEVVRSGIQSVQRGQVEAAAALGLTRGLTLRQVVLPQALRVILPPLTNQYLNLTKNSSLAVAIGYPDLFAVFGGTALSQTGQAVEIIGMTMAVYLLISLATSGLLHLYGWRIERRFRGA